MSGCRRTPVRMSSSVSIATPVRPTSPAQRRSSESSPSSSAGRRPWSTGRTVGEQVLVALVGPPGRGVARVLAHRPRPLAVHVGVHAARVRELPGLAEIQVLGQVRARVQRLDLDARVREPARIIGADDRRDGQVGRRVLVLDGHERRVRGYACARCAVCWSWTFAVLLRLSPLRRTPPTRTRSTSARPPRGALAATNVGWVAHRVGYLRGADLSARGAAWSFREPPARAGVPGPDRVRPVLLRHPPGRASRGIGSGALVDV